MPKSAVDKIEESLTEIREILLSLVTVLTETKMHAILDDRHDCDICRKDGIE